MVIIVILDVFADQFLTTHGYYDYYVLWLQINSLDV